ncbi:hypothetical protein D3C71_1433140 [compost metagenome]
MALPQHMLHRSENRVRLQHHPSASAVWRIIDAAMLVAGKIPEIYRLKAGNSFVPSLAQDACPEYGFTHLRKKRQHIDPYHHNSPSIT